MLKDACILNLLEPFGLNLDSAQLGQLRTYLELLTRWNRRINLTAIRTPEGCVTRHFGESLYITRFFSLDGRLLDVGSGAGFPGMALGIVLPKLSKTLLEPVGKKRAFLKEVARACDIPNVEVRPERLDEFCRAPGRVLFDTVTARAVGTIQQITRLAAKCLSPEGRLCLWLGEAQARELAEQTELYRWNNPLPIPLARDRCLLVGLACRPQSSRDVCS